MSQVLLIKSALNTPVASLMPPLDLAKQLTDIISEIYQYCGQSVDENTLYFQVGEVREMLAVNFEHLKIGEIKVAFKNGVNSKYGEWKGLNPKAYLYWLNAYKHDADRMEAKRESQQNLPAKSLTDEDYKKQLDVCYTHWVKTGEVLDYGNALCKWLLRKKYIKWDKTHWEKLVKAATISEESRLQKEKLKHKDRLDKIGVNRINDLIDEIPRSVPKEAARLLVQEFFIKLKEK